jgi:hypothetical protein
VVVTGGGGTATIGGSDAAVVVSVVVVLDVVVVVVGVFPGARGGGLPPVPAPAPDPLWSRPPPLTAELEVLVVRLSGATGDPWGPGEPLVGGWPMTGLWPWSAAPAAVPLPGRVGLEFSDTRADRLPPGMAGPLNTWPRVPSPWSGPLPVTANSTAMIEAGIRMATSDAP